MSSRIKNFIKQSKANRDVEPTNWDSCQTPWGEITITGTEEYLCTLTFGKTSHHQGLKQKSGWAKAVMVSYQEFIEKGKPMGVKLCAKGTAFQEEVWKELLKIPAGKTFSYSDIANKIGQPKAVRAVGTAIGKNPIAVLIPCHQVLPKTGGVGQYAYGSAIKEKLLKFEQSVN